MTVTNSPSTSKPGIFSVATKADREPNSLEATPSTPSDRFHPQLAPARERDLTSSFAKMSWRDRQGAPCLLEGAPSFFAHFAKRVGILTLFTRGRAALQRRVSRSPTSVIPSEGDHSRMRTISESFVCASRREGHGFSPAQTPKGPKECSPGLQPWERAPCAATRERLTFLTNGRAG